MRLITTTATDAAAAAADLPRRLPKHGPLYKSPQYNYHKKKAVIYREGSGRREIGEGAGTTLSEPHENARIETDKPRQCSDRNAPVWYKNAVF
jgi:hypothetical protein